MSEAATRRIRYDAAAWTPLARGAATLARLLRPTLGPRPRAVAITRILGNGPPEVLTSAAFIARRTIRFPDPFENAGAMFVRHAVWRTHELVGDGCATTAVLSERLFAGLAPLLAAGLHPSALDRGLAAGLDVARRELTEQTRRPTAPDRLAALVAGIVQEAEPAALIVDAVDALGPDGVVLVEDGHGAGTTCFCGEGIRWETGCLSPAFLPAGQSVIRTLEPRILVTDWPIERAEQLVPVLEVCARAGERRLLIVAPALAEGALALLLANRDRGALDWICAVRAPSVGLQQARILEDLAVLTGGHCRRREAGERLEQARLDDLGSARQAWATRSGFGILGGRGQRGAIRQRLREVTAEFERADDGHTRSKVRERLGCLVGAAAHLRVGGRTRPEQEERKQRVEAAVRAAQAALAGGTVAGGGAAYVAAAEALAPLARRLPADEAAAVRVLAHALREPLRAIAENAGLPAAPLLVDARRRCPAAAFDVVRCAWVDPEEAGLLDPAPVMQTALDVSGSLVRQLLSVGVVVHRSWPAIDSSP